MTDITSLEVRTAWPELAAEWASCLASSSPEGILRFAADIFAPDIKLASSFAGESVVLIDMIARTTPEIGVFTLDTGRLPEETHELIERVRRRYRIDIEIVLPDRDAVEDLVRRKGPFSFRQSLQNRKECCAIRKVEPLFRALDGQGAWVTGLRRDETESRACVQVAEWDETHGLFKFNPIADWSYEQVWEYIRAHDVPYNELHDRGYASIGCAPCTRPIFPGEGPRAGRWWWEEDTTSKECGLHR